MPTESTLTLVGREELKERIAKVKQVLENVENSLQFTNIPVYVLTNYIKEETNIDITKKIMAKKEIKTQTIEEILADHTPTSEAVKSAVQRYNEERKKKQEQIIIDTLGAVDSIVADHVEHLRSIRAEEKRAQQRILNITAAREAYLADPNQETLADNLRKAGVILSRYVVVE